eukprot:TRINITY_DN9823_c0_g1_i1.p2 TRINITY_DN9823_c0_g1~~TRINITY_DN9823_c0_g1_i1.p2  ORF type:complete len:106 (+),score=39.09 TRINITY_DN9823_c0_g1_i1:289-606(+)
MDVHNPPYPPAPDGALEQLVSITGAEAPYARDLLAAAGGDVAAAVASHFAIEEARGARGGRAGGGGGAGGGGAGGGVGGGGAGGGDSGAFEARRPVGQMSSPPPT